jgi:hypothetical protein
VCLRHRLPPEHECKVALSAVPRASLAAAAALKRAQSTTDAKKSDDEEKPEKKANASSAVSRAVPSVFRSGPCNSNTTTASQIQAATFRTSGSAPVASSSRGREVCPHCQMRFTDVVELVMHVTSVHE